MRFKAQLASADPLARLLQTIEKVSDSMVVHLRPQMIQFAVAADAATSKSLDGMHVCADVGPNRFFWDYQVQSRAEDNHISFFVKTENLSRAVKSCCSDTARGRPEEVWVKLTKKNNMPVLAFDLHLGGNNRVVHEVPVRIVNDPSEVAAYTEPPLGPNASAAVAVIFPSRDFKGLKNVVERMRSVNDWVRITTRPGGGPGAAGGGGGGGGGGDDRDGNGGGGGGGGSGSAELELLVSRPELVTIKTTYPRLGTPSAQQEADDGDLETGADGGGGGGGGGGGEQRACGLVEVKKLLRVLSSLSASDLKIQNAIVCVVPGQMVILKVYMQDDSAGSFIIYYIPCTHEEDP